jgi:DNA-binding transcriptional MocR family regulator
VQQLQAEGYLAARRGSGTSVAGELPDDLVERRGARPASRSKHPALSRRGAALVAAPQGARRLDGPPRAFRLGTPGVDLFPVALWSRLVNRRLRSVTLVQLDYGDSAGLQVLREAIADHVQTARGTRCGAEQVLMVAGAQQGFELVRVAYRERLEALTAAAERFCRGVLRVRPVRTGLHALADLDGVDAGRVSQEAAARGVEATPLSAYCARRKAPVNGLVLGFGAVPRDASWHGMERLASAIEAARRR